MIHHAHPLLTKLGWALALLEILGICVFFAFAAVAHNGYNEPL